MSVLEPLLFEPLLKPRAWGGDRLRHLGKRVPAGGRIGESWELADLPDSIPHGRSKVACGQHAGKSLHELLLTDRDSILGFARLVPANDGRFPLLVKFLDAAEHLSVQVHPDAAYASAVPHAHLKTEAWIVLEAQPGAVVYRGVRPNVTREEFFAALEADSRAASGAGGSVIDQLVAVPVERGDCIYLPSGICHALGAGILAAEVQTASDTTFRVYDWNRNDPNRPLHIEEARRCMRFGSSQEDGAPGLVRRRSALAVTTEGFVTRGLCKTKSFAVEWIDARPNAELPIITNDAPVVWSVIDGEATLAAPDGRALRLRNGDTALMPARLSGWIARFPYAGSILRVTVPSTLDTMLAGP